MFSWWIWIIPAVLTGLMLFVIMIKEEETQDEIELTDYETFLLLEEEEEII